ncbi:MAG TPA: hypothetical protein DF383_05445, partial [Deltaproteobacteria bacterium]|nr:hypothetical protein [Deltaproteobacteria bacterium]
RQKALRVASQVLVEDWVEKMKSYGAAEKRHSFAALLEGLDSASNPGLKWIRPWLKKYGKNQYIIEITINHRVLGKLDTRTRNELIFFSDTLSEISEAMGLEKNIFHSGDIYNSNEQESYVIRIPPVDLMLDGPDWMSGK